MSVGVMKDYKLKLRKLRTLYTLRVKDGFWVPFSVVCYKFCLLFIMNQ
jgi:hypothetical protein